MIAFGPSDAYSYFVVTHAKSAGHSQMASDFRLKEQLPELTREIVQTYDDIGAINHLGHCPLPSYEVIISVIEDLLGSTRRPPRK